MDGKHTFNAAGRSIFGIYSIFKRFEICGRLDLQCCGYLGNTMHMWDKFLNGLVLEQDFVSRSFLRHLSLPMSACSKGIFAYFRNNSSIQWRSLLIEFYAHVLPSKGCWVGAPLLSLLSVCILPSEHRQSS